MIELSDEDIAKWKDVFLKSGIRYDADSDYKEAAENLIDYVDLLIQIERSQNGTASHISD